MATLASSQYAIDPETGLPIDPETGQPLQLPQQSPQPLGSIYGSPQDATIPGTIANPNAPLEQRYTQNANIANALGTQINNEALYQMGYYGAQTPKYQSQMDTQLANLAGTPGYNSDEANKIGVDYSQFQTTPGEYSAIAGDPHAAQLKAEEGAAGEGAMLNQYQGNLSGQVGNYATGVGGAADQYGVGVNQAVGGLKSGLQGAQNWDMLNSAVSSPGLEFDPNKTEKQLTDQDVQNMKTSAGTRIGNQYRNAEDTLERQAAEAGNTSPLALAAARARLQNQEAADQGDAELNADIAARQAQYQRAAGIEGQRIGAEQTKSGMRATAGTTEEAAAQAAAGLGGAQDIAAQKDIGAARLGAAQSIGQQGINAANQYGQTSIQTQADIANRTTQAAQAADQAASNRATTTAQMRYGEGTGTAAANAQGAAAIGNARMAGNAALRQGIAGQEGWAQTGGNQAAQQQNQAYGTQVNGLNSAAASQGAFENGKASFGDTFMKSLGSALGSGIGGMVGPPKTAKGGMFAGSQTRVVGEKGPEMVMPLGGRYGEGKLVTHPTIAKLNNEAVVPLNNKMGNHTRPDMLAGMVTPPKISGMRYQKHKNFTNPAY